MCGIAGIYRRGGVTPADGDQIRHMNAIQKHRGPDDEGIFAGEHCILGHQRLAIIDLSRAGHQPFRSDDDRYQMVFNGEIYNYIELREELSNLGWRFNTQTDTEVLLKAFQQYGPACLTKFNGMFAFVIYDTASKTLFMARDRVGIKPLYYLRTADVFYFASEIKALRSAPEVHFDVNHQAVFDYLVFNRTDIHDETFHTQIKRVPKGCYAIYDESGLALTRWWDPERFRHPGNSVQLPEALERLESEMFSAVILRMRSDVPVGSCLSGGLDSSILIGILSASGFLRTNFPTFTAAFENHALDETGYVDALKRCYPFANARTYPTASSAFEHLSEFVYANDEPTTSPSFYSQYEVMRLAHEKGITVLLDGQGGDENFAGYQYFHGFNMVGLLREKKYLSFGKELVNSLLRKQDKSAYQTLLFQILPDTVRKKLLLATVPYIQPDFFHAYIDSSRIYTEFFEVEGLNHSLVRHFQYKLEHLLRMEDRNSMAFSIEARVPYLDHHVVEYVLGLPEAWKIRHGESKYLQKVALGKYTIPEILNRRDKIGFGTPGDEWLQTPKWQEFTENSFHFLRDLWPEIFKPGHPLPAKAGDRWKINQLVVWKDCCQPAGSQN